MFALALRQSFTGAFNSDGAGNVLQGQALLDGNLLLRGWWATDVSFYTTELPEYALVTAIRGISPDVVHICGALTYTLTVVLAALLARAGKPGQGPWGPAIAVAIMLPPSILGGTQVFLENPDHAGTSVPVLLTFILLAWVRRRWLGPASVFVLLTCTQLADELALVAAAAPVAAVSVVRLGAAALRWRPGAAARGNGGPGRGDGGAGRGADWLLLIAALGSVAATRVAEAVIRALGGFDLQPLPGLFARPGQVPANAGVLWDSIVLLFGANRPGAPRPSMHGWQPELVAVADLHVIGLTLAVAGLAVGLAAFFSARADRVTQVLVAAIGAVMVAGVFGTVLHNLANAHEVAILLPLGAALAGRVLPAAARRLLPPRLPAARLPAPPLPRGPFRRHPFPGPGRALPRPLLPGVRPGQRVAALAIGAWLTLDVAAFCLATAWPAAPLSQQAVADWLTANGQRVGLAAYWEAESTTVTSGGRVLVAPLTPDAAEPDHWGASADWFRPGAYRATFVLAAATPADVNGLAPAAVRARFGPPVMMHRVGGELIMIYDYNLLTRLRGAG